MIQEKEKQGKRNFSQQNSPRRENLSMLIIESTVYHRIELRSIQNLYKLSVSSTKPSIILIQNFAVLKYIMTHSQFYQMIANIKGIISLTLILPGYGIFNQSNEIEYITNFLKMVDQNLGPNSTLKSLIFSLPGWRTIDFRLIQSICSLISSCYGIKQLTVNFSNAMNLNDKNELQNQFYDERTFTTEVFSSFLKTLSHTFVRQQSQLENIQLKFSGWFGLTNQAIQLLIQFFSQIKTIQSIKKLTLDLNSWGTSPHFKSETIQQLASQFQKFLSLEDMHLDFRNWSQKHDTSQFKAIHHRNKSNTLLESLSGSKGFAISGSLFSKSHPALKNVRVTVLQ